MFILSLILISVASLYGQENFKKKIDSLLIVSKIPDTTYSAYEEIASIIQHASKEESHSFFEYSISKDSSDLSKIFIYKGYSRNLDRIGEVKKSLNYKHKGLLLTEKNGINSLSIYYYIAIANAYHYNNKLDSSTYYINKAENLIKKDNNLKDWQWQVYYKRALVQTSLNNLDKAANNYQLMWNEVDKSSISTSQNRGFALWVITYFFVQTNQFPEEQTKFLNLLATQYEQKDPDVPSGHIDLRNLFKDEIKSQNIDKYKKLATISNSLNHINSYYYNTETLAQILNKENRPKEAIFFLKKLEQKLQQVEKPIFQIGTYKNLTKNYIASNNYVEAFRFREKEYKLRDSLISNKMRDNVAELEVSYETEKKERQIAEQELTIERKDKEQYQIKLGIIALAIIFILSLLFFIYRIKLQKKFTIQQEQLRLKEITTLKQNNKLLALNSMIEGQESERLRIAQDLHDSLGGLLSTVKSHFSIIQREIKQLEKLNITSKTNSLIDEACTEVRRISHNMLPHSLTISGLQGVLEDIKEQLETEGYEVIFEMDDLHKSNDTTRDVMIYRLLQEIISNMRKHANAKSIFLQILKTDNTYSILFEDDGKGFDYQQAIEKEGLGLKSINSRVAYLDGSIDWDSRIEQGTSITITIPVK